MSWVRFDDQFSIHRKVSGLSDAEYRLHTEAIFWCARNLTDGRIGRDELRSVSGISRPDRHVTALVSRGLWSESDGGWQVHDYLRYQPSRKKVLALRAARAAAGRLGGVKSGQTRRSKSEAPAKQDASRLVEPPDPSSSTKKGTGNGRVARPPDLSDVRALLADAARKNRTDATRRAGAFEELRRRTDPQPAENEGAA